jgi:uncharacterized protein DUF4304
MAKIVASNAGLLKDVGFRKRRHSFNRASPDGLVHVVAFWMAPKEPPAWTEVPGLRTRLYGNFRLDFGVYVPEMRRSGTPRAAWINEYNCHLRRTMGQLITGDDRSDLWWNLHDDLASEDAHAVLEHHGIPWLDMFPSRASILRRFEADGPLALGMSPAGGLDIAEMLDAIGRPSDARRTLERYLERPVLRSHAGYLEKLSPEDRPGRPGFSDHDR